MDLFALDKRKSPAVRRLIGFLSCVLLVASTIALGNQPEFKSGGSSRSNLGTLRDPNNETGRAPLVPPNLQEPPQSRAPSELDGIEVLTGTRPPDAVPPKPGRYRYRFTVREAEGAQQSEHTFEIVVTVSTISSSDAETRFIYTTVGGGSPLKYEVSWTFDQVLHLRWFSEGENGFNCDWNPDLQHLKLPLDPSSGWSGKTSCDGTAGNDPQRIENEDEVVVTDAVRARVAGTRVAGWRLERDSKLIFTSDGDSETQIRTGIDIFSPQNGLVVKSIVRVSGTSASGAPTEREEIMELLNLQPS